MKRYISFLLAAIMLLTLLPVSAAADSSMTASEDMKTIIKGYESCALDAYQNDGETYYTIGYGHYGPDVYPGMHISASQANEYFEQDIKRFEKAVNSYNTKYNLNLTQNQFDALVSFTYGVGDGFLDVYPSSSWRISKYIKSGFKDANGNRIPDLEIADAMGVICSSNKKILDGLVYRRLAETNIFFFNQYLFINKYTDVSSHFVAVRIEANGGSIANGNRIVFYYNNQPYGDLPKVTRSGYNLAYWKDASGNKVTNSTVASGKIIDLTAVWTTGAVPAKYTLNVVNGTGSGSYEAGAKVQITPNQKTGYTFDHWNVSGGTVSTENGKYYITMPKNNVTATAYYTHTCAYGDNCPSKKFKDVQPDFWAHDSIGFVVSEGLFYGTDSDKFSPGLTMTRGMLITVLYRLAGNPAVEGIENPFTDVKEDAYYCMPILWAHSKHIANGYDDETFRPNQELTREQLATFLHRYANNMGFDTSNYTDLGKYADARSVSEFARESMCWAVGEGIIKGTTTTTLSPTKSASRAEVATMIMRFAGGAL